jgi:hypothetical protein
MEAVITREPVSLSSMPCINEKERDTLTKIEIEICEKTIAVNNVWKLHSRSSGFLSPGLA